MCHGAAKHLLSSYVRLYAYVWMCADILWHVCRYVMQVNVELLMWMNVYRGIIDVETQQVHVLENEVLSLSKAMNTMSPAGAAAAKKHAFSQPLQVACHDIFSVSTLLAQPD